MKKILLLREDNRADKLFFKKRAYQVLEVPLSRLLVRNLTKKECADLTEADWLFLTSQAPVKMLFSFLTELSKIPRIAVLGKKTAQVVEEIGLTVDFIPDVATKEALIKEWQAKFPAEAKIFYPKSNLADDSLSQKLLNCQVTSVVCYENQFYEEHQLVLEKILREKEISTVYFASPSSWARFYSSYKKNYYPLEFIAIGATTKAAIEKLGFSAKIKK
ncbi:uroporphyrinogen-III synthase [Lactococcus nasutitermitis]|uniref:Uroporphyrinogen-III synthase n=1 Tax=Lactococcus nasutitermitis TaxID=1652957 RepID=A0ABV9JCL6_9LACT|nr:uroporphyrinogen-III synthase [Lactococcus nasutitermitis]